MNYSKKGINIISFIVSFFIFLFIIYFLYNLGSTENPNNSNSIEQIIQEYKKIENAKDIKLEEIFKWKIIIEKLNLEANIEEGTDDEILQNSVGHYLNSSYLYGCIILKAYNTGENKKYFANLKELQIGDEIEYEVNETLTKYKVISNKIIINDEEYVNKLKDTYKNNIILITYVKDMPNKLRCVIAEK